MSHLGLVVRTATLCRPPQEEATPLTRSGVGSCVHRWGASGSLNPSFSAAC
jgi:hypothetical protein